MSQRPLISFLSSIDTPMTPEHGSSVPSRSEILPDSRISALVNNPETFSDPFWPAHYASRTYGASRVWSSLHGPQNSVLSFQDYAQYELDHSFSNMEGTFTLNKPEEQKFWNIHSLNGPESSTTPISHSSYIRDPEHQQLHEAVINPQKIRREPFTIPVKENYDSGGESLPSSSSSSRRSSPSREMKVTGAKNLDVTRSPATINDDESDGDGSSNSEPYAQLIYRALKSVPGRAMVLKELYEWFEIYTDKAKDPLSKGWQNSIRHNLSMNGAFRKVEQVSSVDESRKGYIWVLEESALIEGVKSTTRYRKHNPHKKSGKAEAPAPQRQRSGAKGGKAAKKAARMKRSIRMDEPRPFRYVEGHPAAYGSTSIMDMHAQGLADPSFSSDPTPYYLHASASPAESLIFEDNQYGYSNAATCSSTSPGEGLFYDTCNDSMLTCGPFYDPEDGFLKSEP